jgi:hypothetical protein
MNVPAAGQKCLVIVGGGNGRLLRASLMRWITQPSDA